MDVFSKAPLVVLLLSPDLLAHGRPLSTRAISDPWDDVDKSLRDQLARLQQGPAAAAEPVTILFVGANPVDASWGDLDREVEEIRYQLRHAPHSDHLRLVAELDVPLRDLIRLLLRYRPTIVHFSCHTTFRGDLVLVGEKRKGEIVPGQGIVKILRGLGSSGPRCVVLNTDISVALAPLLVEVTESAVGLPAPLSSKSAIAMASAFYSALAFGRSVEVAYHLAAAHAMPVSDSPHSAPVLCVRDGVDPAAIRFFDER